MGIEVGTQSKPYYFKMMETVSLVTNERKSINATEKMQNSSTILPCKNVLRLRSNRLFFIAECSMFHLISN